MTPPNDETSGTELVPAATRQGPSAAHRLDEAGFSELEPPAAGQYWRLSRSLKATNTRMASHPDVDAGLVLLIKEVESQVDGTPHAVHLAPHPDWYRAGRGDPGVLKFLYDGFLDLWERAPDAESVRARELMGLQEEMARTQREMLSPPPAPAIEGLLRHEPSPNEGGSGRELATQQGLGHVVAHAEAVKAHAEAQVKWITEHNDTLAGQGYKMARYHQERAEAALARANASIKGLDKVYDMVRNLKLYTGEDVVVVQVAQGNPAPPEARLTFYQDVLALDEELLINLAGGGMSHHDLAALPEVLADPAMANRLIPAQRGFVLCRFRATDKEFFKTSARATASEAVGAAMANAEENKVAKEHRLLYRDGERFYIISCSSVFPSIQQLMPSTGEQDGYYHRETWFGDRRSDRTDPGYDRITPDDLDYAAAQRRQFGVLGDYARVLVICWGLHDRTELFSTTSIPKFSNWLDPGFQAARLALVSQDTLIGETREEYAAYRQRMNEFLGPGTTVVLDTRVDRDYEHVPALFGPSVYDRIRRESVRSLVYKPVAPFVVGRVRQQAGRLYVEVPATYNGFSDKDRTITAKWTVSPGDEGILVLDRLHAADLGYYLTSRRQRRQYAAYIEMFLKARDYVAARDAAEAPVRAFLRQSVHEARLPHDEERLEESLTAAIAAWRTARSDKGLVLPGEKGWDTARKALLNALHSAIASHASRIAAVQILCAAEGRIPLRLSHKGNDSWHLYATATEAERDPRLGAWPWVADIIVQFAADGTASIRSVSPVLLRKNPGELIVKEWPEAAACEKAQSPENMTVAAIIKTLDAAEDIAARATLATSGEDLVALAREGLRWSHGKSKGSVVRPMLAIPVGTASLAQVAIRREPRPGADRLGMGASDEQRYIDTFERTGDEPRVLMAGVDLWGYCYVNTSGKAREAVMDAATSWYENKERARDRLLVLDEKGLAFHLHAIPLRSYAPLMGQSQSMVSGLEGPVPLDASRGGANEWFFGNIEGRERQAWKSAYGDFKVYWGRALRTCRITSLSELGARLFPALPQVCDRPTRSLVGSPGSPVKPPRR